MKNKIKKTLSIFTITGAFASLLIGMTGCTPPSSSSNDTSQEEQVVAKTCQVTFDYNFDNSPKSKVILVKEGESVEEERFPKSTRLRYNIEGWYKDKECTQKWVVGTDKVLNDITLYAKYVQTNDIEVDTNGDVVYNDITVNIGMCDEWYGITDCLKNVVDAFNEEYDGRIKVNVFSLNDIVATDDPDNVPEGKVHYSKVGLKFRGTEDINREYAEYYSIDNVSELAGYKFDINSYYKDQINDTYLGNTLYSYPVASIVPAVYYNKDLMTEYNSSGNLPSTYEEYLALFNSVFTGESRSNFQTIYGEYGWPTWEVMLPTAYAQNETNLYVKDVDTIKNTWVDQSDKMLKTIKRVNSFFAVDGELGSLNANNNLISEVKSGDAFMYVSGRAGLISKVGASINDTSIYDKVGVLPFSGLFGDDEISKKVFVKNYSIGVDMRGFGLTQTETGNLNEIAANALVAKYISENINLENAVAIYPASKALQTELLSKDDNVMVQNVLKNVGDPASFTSLEGCMKEYRMFQGTKLSIDKNEEEQYGFSQQFADAYLASKDFTDEEFLQIIMKYGTKIAAFLSY